MAGSDLVLFVSHVSEDRVAATEIVGELERRGVRCWIAPRDVRPGRPFDDEIAAAIDASRAMLLIFSDRCNESEYIRREVTVAGEIQKIIIAFRIEDAQPRRGLRIRLSDLHWIDGFASRERAIDELTEKLSVSDLETEKGAFDGEEHRQRVMAGSAIGATEETDSPVLRRFSLRPPVVIGVVITIALVALLALNQAGMFGVAQGPHGASAPRIGARLDQSKILPVPTPIAILSGHGDTVEAIAYSPNGRMLASGSDDRTIKLWDLADGRILRSLTGHTETVGSVVFSPDGQTLATASDDKTVKLWNVATGQATATLTGHTDYVTGVAFSQDGRILASGSDDKTVKIWDVASGHLLRTLSHSDRVGSVAFSPRGGTLASGSDDKTIEIWDASSGELLRTLADHTDRVEVVGFSTNGEFLASGSDDTTVKLWDWKSGQVLRTLAGHTETVEAVAFSPDGRMLVTASHDHTIKLWDPLNGEPLRTLREDAKTVALAFSPDGRTLAAGSEDHTIKLWNFVELAR